MSGEESQGHGMVSGVMGEGCGFKGCPGSVVRAQVRQSVGPSGFYDPCSQAEKEPVLGSG